MTDRAPRPEGMSDERLKEIAAREAKATAGPWRQMNAGNAPLRDGTLVGQSRVEGLPRPYEAAWVGWQEFPNLPANRHQFETYLRDADAAFIAHARTDIPDLLLEIARLRADGATLLPTDWLRAFDALLRRHEIPDGLIVAEFTAWAARVMKGARVGLHEALAAHSASFGALATLSAALFDGEVDDYAALAEKIIARVRQAEDAMAALREQAGVALGGMVFEIQQALAVRPGEDTFERIAELMRAESDGATLRERVRKLESTVREVDRLTAFGRLSFTNTINDIRTLLASAPKEPTP